jgi:hypothetical protein
MHLIASGNCSAVATLTPDASRAIGEVTDRQCQLEQMLAHGITAQVRVDRYAAAI